MISTLFLLATCASGALLPGPQGTVIKLNGPVAGDVLAFALDPSGTYAVYAADATVVGTTEIFSVRCDGSAPPVRLDEPGTSPRASFLLTPDGRTVVMPRRNDPNGLRIFARPVDGSASATLLATVAPLTEADFALSPDSRRLVYRESRRPGTLVEYLQIHSVPLDGSAPARALSGWGVLEYHIDPSATRVVYRGGGELYSVLLDGSAAPVLLHPPGHNLQSGLQLSADGRWVVYRVDQDGNGSEELFVAPLDGREPPRRLVAPETGAVYSLGVSADSTRVVYSRNEAYADKLWSLRLDGSEAPRGLGAANRSSTELGGAWLVFQDRPPGTFERLWAVPLDGSAAPHELRDVQRPYRFLAGFHISPDGTRVVYGTRFHVLAAPIDGSSEPVVLFPGTAGLSFTPDSRAAILSSRFFSASTQLYRVPLDGSEAPVRLNADLVHGGNVSEFQLSASGRTLVYRADQERDEVFELFALVRPDALRRAPAPGRGP